MIMTGFSGIQIKDTYTPNDLIKVGKRLTPADVHLDRLETNFSLAYANEAQRYVHMRAFPNLPVPRRSNYYALYTKGFWFKSQLAVRAPGSTSVPVQFGVDNTNTYFCDVISGHAPLDEQTEANAELPYDPARDNNLFLTEQAMLYKEIAWAAAYFTTSKWGTDTTPGTKWDQSSSTPVTEIRTGLRTVQKNTGRRPNKIIFGQQAWDIILDHSDIVGRIDRGQTTGTATVTRESVASIFEVDEVMVMGTVQNTADIGQTASMSFIGDTDACLLLYVEPRPGLRRPTAGLTFSWSGLLGANALGGRITSWFEPSRKANIQEIEMAYNFKLTASDLGYFIHTVST
jgi:hypothetical protein